jgi:hypothetical protein
MEQLVRIRNLASVAALCAGSVAIAGCGGSSSSSSSTHPSVAAKRPYQAEAASNLDIGRGKAQHRGSAASGQGGQARSHGGKTSPTIVTRGHKVQQGRPTPALSSDDHNPQSVSAGQPNPCKLVSVAEVKAITGQTITGSLVAPLGPTCVYKVSNSKADITLDVESSNVSQITRHMTKREQLTVRGHSAYCGQLGTQMLFVPLAGGRFLHVTAPCPVAQRLAAVALSRLAA